MIIKYSENGEVEWARSVGGGYDDSIESVVATSDGGAIVGGDFKSSSIQVGEYTLTNNGSYDVMIIKYSENGEVEWARSVGGDSYDYLDSIVETSDRGYIIGAHYSSETISIEDNVEVSGDGIIKYNNNGELQWVKTIGETVRNIYITKTNNGGYLVYGGFSDTINLGEDIEGNNISYTSSGSGSNIMIKYDNNWNLEWANKIGENNYNGIDIIIETQDGGYLLGGSIGVKKYDIFGKLECEQNSGITSVYGLYENQHNEIFIVANTTGQYSARKILKFKGKFQIPNTIVKEAKNIDENVSQIIEAKDGGFLVGGNQLRKYDVNMTLEWEKDGLGNISNIIETDDKGYLIEGSFSDTLDLGEDVYGNPISLTSIGSSDGKIIKLNANLEIEWAKRIGGNKSDSIYDVIETDDQGFVVVGTFYSEVVDLGNDINGNNISLINNGGSYIYGSYSDSPAPDGMMIKYNQKGELEWAKVVGGSSLDHLEGIEKTQDGGFLVGGYFWDSINLGNNITVGER